MKRPLWLQPVAWVVVVLFVVVLAMGGAMRSRTHASHVVTIDAARFDPPVTVVRVGDVITWVNKDLVPHTATSREGGFDSGTIEPGASWKYTATRAGEFPYLCVFHPSMVALLRVK